MKYQNTITGAIIDIESEIIGGPWQALNEPAVSSSEEEKAPVKRKAVKKKDE